jgi:hypothetical protein
MDEDGTRPACQSLRQMHQDPNQTNGRHRRLKTSRISRGFYIVAALSAEALAKAD